MLQRETMKQLDEYLIDLSKRPGKGYYFGRLFCYDQKLDQGLCQYLDAVKQCGVYVKGKIANPDEKQLAYYEEIMGLDFQLDPNFFDQKLKKWLPRMAPQQRQTIGGAIYDTLNEMRCQGKTENMLKNAYIKFMCWFYYKFERIVNQLGKEKLPKILYEGTISTYELKMLCILAQAGCDILLLEVNGDQEYLKLDPQSHYSNAILTQGAPFPQGFSAVDLQKKMQPATPARPQLQRPSQQQQIVSDPTPVKLERPAKLVQINTWLCGDIFADSLKEQKERGVDASSYYSIFAKMTGVEDDATYESELLKWKLKLETDRTVVIIEKNIDIPDPVEIQKIKRKNYQTIQQMVGDILLQIVFPKNRDIEKYVKVAIADQLLAEEKQSLQKLTNRAVCLACWFYRYIPMLFPDWKMNQLPAFVFYGACDNANEAYFLQALSRLPVDVLIFCPDLSLPCKLNDQLLYDKTYMETMELGKFPTQIDDIRFGTVAYHAEQDLNTIMYQDTGMYRNRQFKKAVPIPIQTTFEEIAILWDQEAAYRPNFEVLDDRVMVPVIFAKVSGVPNGVEAYWEYIAKLVTKDSYLISALPYIKPTDANPMKALATGFIKNGKLLADKIKKHPAYPYSYIRQDMQDYMLDKLQQLIDKKWLAGTGSAGMEYTIIAVALNMNKEIMRLIQKYDFTKTIPKLLMINTGETGCSVEDSILTAYLSLLGFDIAIFTPTGYQSVERFFEQQLFVEHQVGEYVYNLNVPVAKLNKTEKEGFASKLFRRGR